MRKQANSMLAALGAANDTIPRATSHKAPHQRVCDAIIEGGGARNTSLMMPR
jgi:hypothetical protein